MQSPIWYLRTPDGQQYGPVNKIQLDQWAAEGRVGQDCWLWRAGWADWQGAGAVYSRLGQALASAPTVPTGLASPGAQTSPVSPGPMQAQATDVGKETKPAGTPATPSFQEAQPGLEDPQRWVGQTLGHYQLVQYIGRGPSGAVYKARHVALERWAAVRLIPIGGNTRLFEQLSQGLRAAVRLSHPHLVEVHDMGDTGGLVYLAMELMEGGSLADWIRRAGRLPPPVAIAIFHQVVSALAAVHQAGLLHRDIKPSNILFTGPGSAKLSDLGLAALSEARLRAGPASVGSSAYYTAPEIFQGQPASVRSDLYSLGATFYHALTGRLPGEGATVEEFFRRRGDVPIQPIGALLPGLPPGMGAMIDRLLLKDPGLRFSSAGELVEMLQRMGGAIGGPAVRS
ncbi:MAG TPA: protein kinase, partial [Thermoguttaceae bacterium]|nr:protein kinase [Thermoguttaceae bacterium]